MFTSNMLYRYYSYNAFYYMFNDYSLVRAGVLGDLSDADAATVYNDDLYGMSNITPLTYWVFANQGIGTSYADIQTYYAALGINLTD